jgi:hypothetical protein
MNNGAEIWRKKNENQRHGTKHGTGPLNLGTNEQDLAVATVPEFATVPSDTAAAVLLKK